MVVLPRPRRIVKPRPANPTAFQVGFFGGSKGKGYRGVHHVKPPHRHGPGNFGPGASNRRRDPPPPPPQRRQPPERPPVTLGEHLQAAHEVVPFSSWVRVDGIAPASSLDAMLAGVNDALDAQQARGMIDLDAPWSEGQDIPFLEQQPQEQDEASNDNDDVDPKYKWVRRAKIILSPYGRPKGW